MELSQFTYYNGAKFTIWEMVKLHKHVVTISRTMEGETGKGWDIHLVDANNIGLKLNRKPFATRKAAKDAAVNAYGFHPVFA